MNSFFNYSEDQKRALEKSERNIIKHLSRIAFVRYMRKNKNIICL